MDLAAIYEVFALGAAFGALCAFAARNSLEGGNGRRRDARRCVTGGGRRHGYPAR